MASVSKNWNNNRSEGNFVHYNVNVYTNETASTADTVTFDQAVNKLHVVNAGIVTLEATVNDIKKELLPGEAYEWEGAAIDQITIKSSESRQLVIVDGYLRVWDPNPGMEEKIYKELSVPLFAMREPSSNSGAFTKIKDDGETSASTGVNAYAFDKATEESLYAQVKIPYDFTPGNDLIPHIHWAPATNDEGDCVWGIEYVITKPGAAVPATEIITAKQAGADTALTHQVITFDEIAGKDEEGDTVLDETCELLLRVFRKAGDEADTLDGDAWLLGVDFVYEVQKPGTIGIPAEENVPESAQA